MKPTKMKTETRFTAGPWGQSKRDKNEYGLFQYRIITMPENRLPSKGHKTIIGTVIGGSEEITLANANLIATSPDMEKFCKGVELYGNDRFLSQFENFDQLILEFKSLAKKASDILAKANPQPEKV